MPTKQETFDTVVRFLRTQGRGSFKPHPKYKGMKFCMFRSPDGCKCAAGCLIPDELYDESMEGNGSLMFPGAGRDIIVREGHDLDLVTRLQHAHDDAAGFPGDFLTTFLAQASIVALVEDLDPKECQ